jgi:hypothetical protein
MAPQTTGEITMTVKNLKITAREEWRPQLEKLAKEYPLTPYTDASRTFSMVRRMKAEKGMGVPISLRSGFAISTKTGRSANAMTKDKWEEFYTALSGYLKLEYPDLYERLFLPD